MKPRSFKDHFSDASASYRSNRPTYPDSLFTFLASLAPSTQCAWDCATGTGQAAQVLAHHFNRIIATDASNTQIASAEPDAKIDYRVARAEDSGIPSATVDLITVAQALHWFDIPAFFSEAKRVLKPRGILAVWNYNLLTVTPEIDAVVAQLYGPLLDEYWPAERRLVESDYRDIAFPFEAMNTPDFVMQSEWSLYQLLGYLRTWSAVRRYQQARGSDPVAIIEEEIAYLWGEHEQQRTIYWPLKIHVRRCSDLI